MTFLAEKDNISLLIDIAFYADVKWSGGKARSMQLYEILQNDGFTLTAVEEPKRPGKLSLLCWALKGIMRFGIYKPLCLDSLRTTGFNYFRISCYTKKFSHIHTYAMEGTGFGDLQKVSMLKSFGKRIILIPANIESLAPYPNAWTHQVSVMHRYKEELQYYKKADAVFCISIEETWLLQIFGAPAFFLPYYPPSLVQKKINVRVEKRKQLPGSGIFYFANFNNSPNYFGFKDFVKSKAYEGLTLKVAGFGTGKIMPLIEGKKEFQVLGELSDEELEEQLIACEKVFINHYPTSGMLTRIPELLLSGIPIVGNLPALKSYSLFIQQGQDYGYRHLFELSASASRLLLNKLSEH